MAINKELKDLIRLIKYRSGLNQSVIAENLGVTNSYLSDAINGRVPFSDSLRNKIYENYSDYITNPHIVFGGQHVTGGGDAVNGDKIVEKIKEEVEDEQVEEVTVIKKVKCDLDDIRKELADLKKTHAEVVSQNSRLLAIIENLTNPK
ncbi:hypothetical protein [uncultured Duncaniella sp.]|uniref:hypothetical protein n=1 Tax=uncultured Duncaniella sp. TaxID=2768039 RepID=UPI00259D12AC|nr:hypothetical protein [uncultured Duncaniella sp.]